VTILDEILEHKRVEVARAKVGRDSAELWHRAATSSAPVRGFRDALRSTDGVAVIAEVKRQSPSKGLIREDFDPVEIARAYAAAGAACISVLTDERFFGGSLDALERIRGAVDRPLLRKDFVVDPDQIAEARIAGADAVLLIVSALEQPELDSFQAQARSLGLDVLVEVHDEAELERALAIGADLIGVNNRNLKTFAVDLGTTQRIAARLPGGHDIVLVAESGIRDIDDIKRLEAVGARAFLVGESLMRQPDPGKALEALRFGKRVEPVSQPGKGIAS
jgi:indole-3-glycerol phosphate synthase